MSHLKGEQIASVVLAFLAALYLLLAFFLPVPQIKQVLGPDAFPKAIGILMLCLALVYVWQQFRGKTQEDEMRAAIIGADDKVGSIADTKTVAIMIGLMVAYAAFFELLGYPISTFLMFMAGVLVLDRRHLARDTVIAVLVSFGLYFLFVYFLRVQLPSGPLRWLGFL